MQRNTISKMLFRKIVISGNEPGETVNQCGVFRTILMRRQAYEKDSKTIYTLHTTSLTGPFFFISKHYLKILNPHVCSTKIY